MSQLVISRQRARWQDLMRDYSVLVDGNEVAKLENGAETTITLEPGSHRVRIDIDWCHSPELQVSLAPGETVHLECGPNANPFLVIPYITLWKDRYLWLREHASAA